MKYLHPLSMVTVVLVASVLSLACNRVGLAQVESKSESPAEGKSAVTGLEYVPPDAMLVASIRPAALLSHPAVKNLRDIVAKDEMSQRLFGMPLADISQITAIPLPADRPDARDAFGFVIHTVNPIDEQGILDVVAPSAEKKKFEGHVYYQDKPRRQLRYIYFPDNRTVIFADQEAAFQHLIHAGRSGAGSADWTKSWSAAKDAHVAIVGNPDQIKAFMDKATAGAPEGALQTIAPLWNNGTNAIVSLVLDEQLKLRGQYTCKTPADAPETEKALKAVLALATSRFENLQQQLTSNTRTPKLASTFTGLALQLLKEITIEQKGQIVRLQAKIDAQTTSQLLAQLATEVQSSRNRAQRRLSFNNIKHLGLAMHNYHSVHGHFPPPTLLGPDGKTVHSWRVALLPYLDEQELYDEYHTDEPWDSPHNKKLVKKMPSTFGHPIAKTEPGYTSYFVLTGKETAFVGKKGTSIRDIVDGTSNTILVVESKPEVPWTKPVDILYDSKKPLPKLGGYDPEGFCTGFCDGSARFLVHGTLEKTFRAWFTMDGGELISNNP
ncbi:DUF1559 family PulG-like putative transporter [Symmachiella macrocystis]|uniref:DUF1559 family PulG-like putative transporter n=1 Tax=Symmachiella macrocystis TaxID=2527985 RepID=UPI0018D36071|nr:DUF1559 domain-containing protein [Symmachiella macrocystis]